MLQEKLVSSGIAGLLSLVPGVGAAVSELMTELAIQRTNNRVKEMFEHFTARVHEVGEEKVDREWFRSEEFQTLLYEAFSQLNVTHDREKIEMLGTALGNSGAPGFKEEERKDLFIRFVRDLTRQHVKVLLQLVPNYLPMRASGTVEPLNEETERKLKWGSRPTVNPRADDLLVLQMLHAYGLVEEHINSSIVQPRIPARFTSENQMIGALKKVTKNMEHPTVTRSFRLSPLGNDFLKFMGLPKA
ncbi:MAG: hypothetical protein HY010_13135 [Acidobacteria bacterium]|nr:hypothetical protein [Acidobacteriota bacterium]